jgi:hypothetical protein
MPMNYKLVENKNKSVYYVKETKTDHIIESFSNFAEAKNFMKQLNLGGGFDGWTPAFMTIKL